MCCAISPCASMRSKKDLRRSCRTADAARSATVTGIAAAAAALAALVSASRARPCRNWLKEARNERRRAPGRWTSRDAAALLPAAEILPVLGAARAQDRLQGCEAAAALRVRARQDRAEPHHRRLDQEAAGTRPGDQARAVSRPSALQRAIAGGGHGRCHPARASGKTGPDGPGRQSPA